MGCAPVMVFGKAIRASLCTADKRGIWRPARRQRNGVPGLGERRFANQLAWRLDRDGVGRLREFNRPRRW